MIFEVKVQNKDGTLRHYRPLPTTIEDGVKEYTESIKLVGGASLFSNHVTVSQTKLSLRSEAASLDIGSVTFTDGTNTVGRIVAPTGVGNPAVAVMGVGAMPVHLDSDVGIALLSGPANDSSYVTVNLFNAGTFQVMSQNRKVYVTATGTHIDNSPLHMHELDIVEAKDITATGTISSKTKRVGKFLGDNASSKWASGDVDTDAALFSDTREIGDIFRATSFDARRIWMYVGADEWKRITN